MVLGQPLSQNNFSPLSSFLPHLPSPSPLHLLGPSRFCNSATLRSGGKHLSDNYCSPPLFLSPGGSHPPRDTPTNPFASVSLSHSGGSGLSGNTASLLENNLFRLSRPTSGFSRLSGSTSSLPPLYSLEPPSVYLPCALGSHTFLTTPPHFARILFRLSRLTSGGSSIPDNISSLLAIIVLHLSCDFSALPPLYSLVQPPLSLSLQTSFSHRAGGNSFPQFFSCRWSPNVECTSRLLANIFELAPLLPHHPIGAYHVLAVSSDILSDLFLPV